MSQYFQQVNLAIHHNWEHTKLQMMKMLALEGRVPAEVYGLSDHYDLKSLGTLSKHQLSPSWYRFAGPTINKTMPWLTEMLAAMQELQPDDGCISFMAGNGGEHVDDPTMRSALNYIFESSDLTSHTWVKYNNNVSEYPSDINTAWILDTQKPHGITNNGNRWTLSIHFNSDYSTVKKWFQDHPQLIFGKN